MPTGMNDHKEIKQGVINYGLHSAFVKEMIRTWASNVRATPADCSLDRRGRGKGSWGRQREVGEGKEVKIFNKETKKNKTYSYSSIMAKRSTFMATPSCFNS